MDPNQQPVGRARGRGRGLYQHPTPFHAKDGHPGPQREPWSLASGAPRPPAPQPGRQIMGLKHSSSEDSASKGRGAPKMPATSAGSDPSKRVMYPEGRPDNLRGKIRPTQNVPEALIYTRPTEITSKCGTTGQKITCEANYFRLDKQPNWNIYQYRVDFSPEVESMQFRRYLVGTLREMLGGFLFDGTQLFLTRQLESDTVERTARGQTDDTPYTITIRLTTIVSPKELHFLQVLNLILRRSMDGLRLETIGRNKFDAQAAISVPNLRLEIWPGYITSIRQHEEDILVCAEISHKIMRAETVYDIMKRIQAESRDTKAQIEKALLGTTVLTRYNNKTYRIDEITYDIKPSDTFKMRGEDVSYIQYYKNRYKIDIRDPNQPMLISNVKKKDLRAGQSEEVLLIPELCSATGLTDEMRSNYRTMKDIAVHTRVGPSKRIDSLLRFNERLRASNDSARHLTEWNLALNPQLVKIPARILPYPDIVFGDRKANTNSRADWTNEFRNNTMAACIELKRWFVITPARAKREAEEFVSSLQRAGRGMRFMISNPRYVELPNDIQTAVSNAIGDCANNNPQMIMCVVSNNQGDRYATIKKRCYLDHGLPSQVIVHRTISPKDKSKGLMSIATKVAIQMNAKLGGLPWLIDIPISGLMTCGYDVCHDPKNKKFSWGALVSTMDLRAKNTQFFSAVNRHENGEELSNTLALNMAKAIEQFFKINGALPARILFFRDGVGDGQIAYVYEHEVTKIKDALKRVYEKHGLPEVPFMYMIVTKRVNTRIFFDRRNPDPGTCVDDIITLPERYDFYLISQSIREGTVSPTGFNIVHDTIGIPPDRVQQLAFRFTYFYFNWSGTVRVPALCQYAHKLAFLASQSMQASPQGDAAKKLEQTLYFL